MGVECGLTQIQMPTANKRGNEAYPTEKIRLELFEFPCWSRRLCWNGQAGFFGEAT